MNATDSVGVLVCGRIGLILSLILIQCHQSLILTHGSWSYLLEHIPYVLMSEAGATREEIVEELLCISWQLAPPALVRLFV